MKRTPYQPTAKQVWDDVKAANDMVNHPPHYTTGKIECLDFIEDQQFGYLDGQVIKYVTRARHKGSQVEDLKKARFYLDRLIKTLDA